MLAERQGSFLRVRLARIIGTVWIAAVAGYFASEAWSYSGVFARISEWQFSAFDQSWPMATFLILAGICAIPGLMVLVLAERRRPVAEGEDRLVHDAQRVMRILRFIGFGLAIASFLCLVPIAFLPGKGGPIQEIAARQNRQGAPSEGAARIMGDVLMSRMTTLQQNLVFARRQLRLAPILPGPGERVVRYLVQVTPNEIEAARTGNPPLVFSGVLVRQGLPGTLRTLYHDAGIPLADSPLVLYRYSSTLYRPYFVAALQCALMAMIVLLAWFWQRRNLRTEMRRSIAPRVTATDAAMTLPDDKGLRPVKDVLESAAGAS